MVLSTFLCLETFQASTCFWMLAINHESWLRNSQRAAKHNSLDTSFSTTKGMSRNGA